jgi:hypothetical protein
MLRRVLLLCLFGDDNLQVAEPLLHARRTAAA